MGRWGPKPLQSGGLKKMTLSTLFPVIAIATNLFFGAATALGLFGGGLEDFSPALCQQKSEKKNINKQIGCMLKNF